MRGGRNPDILFSKMKKKPALQAVLDKLDEYTVEQLTSLPDQPLWIRTQLVKLRQRNGLTSSQVAEQLADRMTLPAPQQTPQPAREVRVWQGDPAFIGSGLSGQFGIEILPGDIVLLLPPQTSTSHGSVLGHHEVKLDSSVIKLTRTQWDVLLRSTALVGVMTEREYTEEVQRRLAVRYG
jgi:hypothetical protein